jgi:hypothetical protein
VDYEVVYYGKFSSIGCDDVGIRFHFHGKSAFSLRKLGVAAYVAISIRFETKIVEEQVSNKLIVGKTSKTVFFHNA